MDSINEAVFSKHYLSYFITFVSFYPFLVIAPWVRDKRNFNSSIRLANILDAN